MTAAAASTAPTTYRAALVGECPLTTEDQAGLDDDALLDAAMVEADNAGIEVERADLRITTWTEL